MSKNVQICPNMISNMSKSWFQSSRSSLPYFAFGWQEHVAIRSMYCAEDTWNQITPEIHKLHKAFCEARRTLENTQWAVSFKDLQQVNRHLLLKLFQDPYFLRNHLGSYECKLCLTLHTNEGLTANRGSFVEWFHLVDPATMFNLFKPPSRLISVYSLLSVSSLKRFQVKHLMLDIYGYLECLKHFETFWNQSFQEVTWRTPRARSIRSILLDEQLERSRRDMARPGATHKLRQNPVMEHVCIRFLDISWKFWVISSHFESFLDRSLDRFLPFFELCASVFWTRMQRFSLSRKHLQACRGQTPCTASQPILPIIIHHIYIHIYVYTIIIIANL